MGAGEERDEAKAKEQNGDEEEEGAFDVSNIKGRLGKRPTAGGKRGKKGAGEDSDKKKAEAKKPKQKVSVARDRHQESLYSVSRLLKGGSAALPIDMWPVALTGEGRVLCLRES